MFSSADIVWLHSSLIQQQPQGLYLQAMTSWYLVPHHVLQSLAILAALQESLFGFNTSLFSWRTPNWMFYTRCIAGKGGNDFPWCAGKAFMEALRHTQQVKLEKQIPLAYLEKSTPCMCLLWPVRKSEVLFVVSCGIGTTVFFLGRAEGFTEQLHAQPWLSAGGGKASAVRFGKGGQAPGALGVAFAKGDIRPHQVAAQQTAGKPSSISCTRGLNISLFHLPSALAQSKLPILCSFANKKGAGHF